MLGFVQAVALNLCDSMTRPVDQFSTVVHAFAGVDFASTNRTGFVGRVIFVMIVILKVFVEWTGCTKNKLQKEKQPPKDISQAEGLGFHSRRALSTYS